MSTMQSQKRAGKKELTKTVGYSLPVRTVEIIERMAREENRSRSNMLTEIVERYVAANTPTPPSDH